MSLKRTAAAVFAATFITAGCGESTITEIVQVEPPPPVSTPVTINVNASQISGSFTLGGGPFPGSVYQNGDMFLHDTQTGSMLELGDSHDQAYDMMVVNGMYDSVYQHTDGTDVPVNDYATVVSGIAVNSSSTIDIDVPMASVRATFSLNGGAFPASVYNHGSFFLQPVNGEEMVFLGDSHVANDIVNVVPGNYHVIYSHQQGDQVPANTHAQVMSDVAVVGATVLDIDVSSVEVRTSFSLNGGAFPQSQYESAKFFLVDAGGDEVFVGNSFDGPGTVSIVTGTYDIEYRHQQGGAVPLNSASVVVSGATISSGSAIVVDVSSAPLSINATLNGQAFPVSEQQDGILELYDAGSDSFTLLGNTHDSFVGLEIITGTYDIVYSHETGDAVPQNIRGTVQSDYVVAAQQQLDLDVTAYSITGNITLNSSSFPQSQYNVADILLRGSDGSDDIHLFTSYSQSEGALVLGGTYDVIYACHNCINIPFNSGATIVEDFAISSDDVVSANLQSVRVAVSATLNGNPFDSSIYQSGLIWGAMGDGDSVELTRTNVTTSDIILLAGDYDFFYQHQNGDQVPLNSWALVDQQSIAAP